jgi:hypothetical protein
MNLKSNDECIVFNGPHDCGHPKNEEIFVAYPADGTRGVGPGETAIDESANGLVTKIKHRCCSGRCSHEAFCFPKLPVLARSQSRRIETQRV